MMLRSHAALLLLTLLPVVGAWSQVEVSPAPVVTPAETALTPVTESPAAPAIVSAEAPTTIPAPTPTAIPASIPVAAPLVSTPGEVSTPAVEPAAATPASGVTGLADKVIQQVQSYPPETQAGIGLLVALGFPFLFFLLWKRSGRIGGWILPYLLYLLLLAAYIQWLRPLKGHDDIYDWHDLWKDKKVLREIVEKCMRQMLLTWHIVVLPSAILGALLGNRILGAMGFAKKRPNRLKTGAFALEPPPAVVALMAEGYGARVVREEGDSGPFNDFEYDYPYIRFHGVVYDLRKMARFEGAGLVYLLKSGSVIEFGRNKTGKGPV